MKINLAKLIHVYEIVKISTREISTFTVYYLLLDSGLLSMNWFLKWYFYTPIVKFTHSVTLVYYYALQHYTVTIVQVLLLIYDVKM